MATLNKENINEIFENTNHSTLESVESALYTGDIEVFENVGQFENEGYSLKFKDSYLLLSDGKIVYFID